MNLDFHNVRRCLRWYLYSKMYARNLCLKTATLLVFFMWLINNRLFNHLEKFALFSNFQYGFRSSQSTVELLKSYEVTDRITRVFNRLYAARSVVLDISKAFDKIWHAGLPHRLKSYGISGWLFVFISWFLSNRWRWVYPFTCFLILNKSENLFIPVTLKMIKKVITNRPS